MRILAAIAIALTTALAVPTPIGALELSGRARVIDGDTIVLGSRRIRLHGIDAPESAQICQTRDGGAYSCGGVAADRLRALIGAERVSCNSEERDRYGRLISTCRAGGRDLGAEMVRRGWARAYLRYSGDYAELEKEARQNKVGIWSGTFQNPWAFRKERWQLAAQGRDANCPIKGNISKSGRIYHMPYSRDYARTRIDPAKGERWFCSEAEAIAAGWRAARN